MQTTFVPTSRTDCHPTALGTYYWRVIATDTPGQTRDRDDIVTDAINAEVHRFTYDPAVPTLLSPAPAATVEVPTLRWSPVTGADSYRVTVTAVSDGDGGGTFTTTGTSYTPRAQLTAGKTYRWQVQALSASTRVGTGLTTGSQPTFTVAAATATPGSTPEPAGSPAPGSRFPTLSWSPVTDATGYKILVRPVGSIAWTPLADKFSYPAGEDDTEVWLSPGTYEWYVESYFGSVYQSSSTTTSTFTVTSLAPVVGRKVAMTGQALADNATTCATALPERCMDLRHTPVLHWADDPDVGSYKVYLARDEEMTNVLSGYPIRVESTSFIPVSALPDSQAGSAYYWFVQPCKTKTVCAPLAHATNAFNKLSKPVELLSPGVDETRANDITFTWRDYLETNQDPAAFPLTDPSGVHDVAPRVEARQYRIQVSTDANFQSWIDQVTVDQTTFTSATNTYPEGPLFWRVQAIDASGNQLSWSAGSKFFKSSPRVTLLEPLGDMEVSGSVPLRWEPLAYAASYDVQVFRNGDTTGSETNKVDEGNSKQAAIGWTIPMAVSPAPYTWRVRPVDAKGRPGRWTDLDDPDARFYVTGESPVLFDPATDVYVHANDALFTWEGVAGAASYRFERRKVGSASSAESVVTAALAWAPVSLITDGHWQWRVSSLDTAGKVLGSSEWRGFRGGRHPTDGDVVRPPGQGGTDRELRGQVLRAGVDGEQQDVQAHGLGNHDDAAGHGHPQRGRDQGDAQSHRVLEVGEEVHPQAHQGSPGPGGEPAAGDELAGDGEVARPGRYAARVDWLAGHWLDILGWGGSALLVYSLLQTRVLRFRVLNMIASLVLVVFNAFLSVWPMVGHELRAGAHQRLVHRQAARGAARRDRLRGARGRPGRRVPAARAARPRSGHLHVPTGLRLGPRTTRPGRVPGAAR